MSLCQCNSFFFNDSMSLNDDTSFIIGAIFRQLFSFVCFDWRCFDLLLERGPRQVAKCLVPSRPGMDKASLILLLVPLGVFFSFWPCLIWVFRNLAEVIYLEMCASSSSRSRARESAGWSYKSCLQGERRLTLEHAEPARRRRVYSMTEDVMEGLLTPLLSQRR